MKQFARTLHIRAQVSVGLSFVPPKRMRALNKVYRCKDKETDVLSFGPDIERLPETAKKEEKGYLGDIIICPSYAFKEAKRRGIDPREELIRLFVHGLLHLKGYEHQTEEEELVMFKLQENIVEKTL